MLRNALLLMALTMAGTVIGAPLAGAADSRAPAPVVASNWGGFYVGGHVGFGRASSTGSFADPGNTAQFNCAPCFQGFFSSDVDQRDSGFLGGVHLGYNWQVAPAWLVGVEGDFTWTGLASSSNTGLTSFTLGGVPFAVPGTNLNLQTDINWLASFRGRLGFIQNNWLIYATGGIAWADIDFAANASCAVTPGFVGCPAGFGVQAPASLGTIRTGWVAGGGVEWQAPASQWRARAEYLYYAFDGDSVSTPWIYAGGAPAACTTAPSCSANYGFGDVSIHTVRIALSYAFR